MSAAPALIEERDLRFLLYEVLGCAALLDRPRYAEHSVEQFDATLDTARKIALDRFLPHYATGDAEEPAFEAGRVRVTPATRTAWKAFAEAGFLAAHCDFTEGGAQLPEPVMRAAMAYFNAANPGTAAYPFLTIGAANLIATFGSPDQNARFLPPLRDGRCAGTMALTEPAQGSALGDLKTAATAADDGTYRITGQKIYISGGDQDLTDNIVHMVLARVRGAPAGTRGISLFIVPKRIVGADGAAGAPNDVVCAGLLHKMGFRNTTSTVLAFGERDGATGELVGEAGRGLEYMFQMMNEARIGVGLLAAATAYRGYRYSLGYARERRQGRPPSRRDPASPQVALVEHADVRRMLLAQKAYAEGALAMCLHASALFEDQKTHPTPAGRARAALLLDLLTPVVKSWPSRYGCAANDLAIQVAGGAGYVRDHPLEQLYRDQRLNPIHEGAEAIHGLDLLGRKVTLAGGAAFAAFRAEVGATLAAAHGDATLEPIAAAIASRLERLAAVTATLVARAKADPDRGLANATVYLDAFGRIVAAWLWLRQAAAASRGLAERAHDADFYRGKIHAARYYAEWELPPADVELDLLDRDADAPLAMHDAWF